MEGTSNSTDACRGSLKARVTWSPADDVRSLCKTSLASPAPPPFTLSRFCFFDFKCLLAVRAVTHQHTDEVKRMERNLLSLQWCNRAAYRCNNPAYAAGFNAVTPWYCSSPGMFISHCGQLPFRVKTQAACHMHGHVCLCVSKYNSATRLYTKNEYESKTNRSHSDLNTILSVTACILMWKTTNPRFSDYNQFMNGVNWCNSVTQKT